MSDAPTGILVMAYGTASGPDDIERYYTDIRGGRPPTPEHLAELKERYAAIGNRFPLLDITRAQAEGIERDLNARGVGPFKAYLGMKHSPPSIAEAVDAMRADGVERAVGLVLAPHWSEMSVESYIARVTEAVADGGPSFAFVRSFHDHPAFIDLLAKRIAHALGTLGPAERERAAVIFSAHSLPVRTLEDGTLRCKVCGTCETSCRYRDGLQATADLVARELALPHHTIAWQSAGRTADPWWGPPIEDVIADLASAGHPAIVVCSAGFVADHLEILYDLDIEAKQIAEDAGAHFVRTEMPNADPAFVAMLATAAHEALEGAGASETVYAMYPVFKATETFRDLDPDAAAEEVEELFASWGDRTSVRGVYSTVGFRADSDLMLWLVGSTPEDVQDALIAFGRTRAGRGLELVWTFMGVVKPAEFSADHAPAFVKGDPPKRYLNVYPFVRTPEWYLLPREERAELLREHGVVGREFPDVLANTTSAFGINDWEWILAFEADELDRIVDCIRRLRETQARRYTKEEIPFVTGIRKDVRSAFGDLARPAARGMMASGTVLEEVDVAHAKDKGEKHAKKTAQKSIKEKRAAKKAKQGASQPTHLSTSSQ